MPLAVGSALSIRWGWRPTMSDKATLADLKIDRSNDEGASRGRLWLLGLAALVGLGVAAYFFACPRAREVVVGVARISTAGSATVLNASGYVTARRRATVSSKVTARVLEVLIEEGMEVKEGQIVARLDDSNVGASFRLAEAEFRAARTSLEETRVQLAESKLRLDRTKALVADDVVSQAELDRVQAETDSIEARLERQREDEAVADRPRRRLEAAARRHRDPSSVRRARDNEKRATRGDDLARERGGWVHANGHRNDRRHELSGDRGRRQRELHQPRAIRPGSRGGPRRLSRVEDPLPRHRHRADRRSGSGDRAGAHWLRGPGFPVSCRIWASKSRFVTISRNKRDGAP